MAISASVKSCWCVCSQTSPEQKRSPQIRRQPAATKYSRVGTKYRHNRHPEVVHGLYKLVRTIFQSDSQLMRRKRRATERRRRFRQTPNSSDIRMQIQTAMQFDKREGVGPSPFPSSVSPRCVFAHILQVLCGEPRSRAV